MTEETSVVVRALKNLEEVIAAKEGQIDDDGVIAVMAEAAGALKAEMQLTKVLAMHLMDSRSLKPLPVDEDDDTNLMEAIEAMEIRLASRRPPPSDFEKRLALLERIVQHIIPVDLAIDFGLDPQD